MQIIKMKVPSNNEGEGVMGEAVTSSKILIYSKSSWKLAGRANSILENNDEGMTLSTITPGLSKRDAWYHPRPSHYPM